MSRHPSAATIPAIEKKAAEGLSRRDLLDRAARLSPILFAAPAIGCATEPKPIVAMPGDGHALFTLGVASGDPWPDNVVLWTRLAPDPINGGGMPPLPVEVAWEVATDDKMHNVVRRGTTVARPELAHSVHVEVDGLEPGRWYWYRFRTPLEESIVGRTRTAPAPEVMAERFRFAVACCQDYQHGYYAGHNDMLKEDLDLVVFVGDYIYEGWPEAGHARMHNNQDTHTLDEYRNRHALYKTDPFLQANHAMRPWVVTWDDHELGNDYAGPIASWDIDPIQFLARRIAAYQAYYEHMPLRRASIPNDQETRIYRRFDFGRLARFDVLDTRQYRDVQACRGKPHPTCDEYLSPDRTIMGKAQEAWLLDGLKRSDARWNVIAQQVPFVRRALPGERGSTDKWDGYVGSRRRVIETLTAYRTSNPVILTGDIHEAWAADIKADFERPESAVVGSEFITSSLSSGGTGQRNPQVRERMLAANGHMKWANGKRGYVSHEVTPDEWRTTFRGIDSVILQDSPVRTVGSFVIENGRPGVQTA